MRDVEVEMRMNEKEGDVVAYGTVTVDVTPLPDPYAGEARARIVGVATVSVCGLTIRGITVKEGEHGLFVNMPQYRTEDGKYKDLVYGTSRRMQQKIARAVLEAYGGVME